MTGRTPGQTRTEYAKAAVRAWYAAKAGTRADLVRHIEERHSRITSAHAGKLPASWTAADLAREHSKVHWQFGSPNHLHQADGETQGDPTARPRGWYTGLDVIDNPLDKR